MKKIIVGVAFVLIYACGIILSWNIPVVANNLTPIFAILWLFAAARIVSWLVVKVGWERRRDTG